MLVLVALKIAEDELDAEKGLHPAVVSGQVVNDHVHVAEGHRDVRVIAYQIAGRLDGQID